MITPKQLKILGIFNRDAFREYSFKELKEFSNEKSNSVLQNAIKQFLKEDLIEERKIGASKLYKINHDNNKIYSYLDIFIKENLPKPVKKTIEIIKKEIDRLTCFYSIIIFGSYAVNEQKNKSDLDIAIIVEKDKKLVQRALDSAGELSILQIDGHVILKKEFLDMLKIDYENLGKQIARKHLIVHNPKIFYSIMKEGIKNGFSV